MGSTVDRSISDHAVVVGAVLRGERAGSPAGLSVRLTEVLHCYLVRHPDRGEAGRLGGHDVDADPEVHGQRSFTPGPANSRTPVLHKAVTRRSAPHQSQIAASCGPTPWRGAPVQPDQNHARAPGYIIRVAADSCLTSSRPPGPDTRAFPMRRTA